MKTVMKFINVNGRKKRAKLYVLLQEFSKNDFTYWMPYSEFFGLAGQGCTALF